MLGERLNTFKGGESRAAIEERENRLSTLTAALDKVEEKLKEHHKSIFELKNAKKGTVSASFGSKVSDKDMNAVRASLQEMQEQMADLKSFQSKVDGLIKA